MIGFLEFINLNIKKRDLMIMTKTNIECQIL